MKYKKMQDDEGVEIVPGGPTNLKDSIWNVGLQSKHIIINEDIDDSIIEKAVYQLILMNRYDDEQESMLKNYVRTPIEIFLNTAGGKLDEAFSLISVILASRTPVVTIAMGKCWSAGFLILLAGHIRLAQEFSSIMYHQGSAGIQSDFSKAIEYARYWEKCQERVEKYVADRTKIKSKRLREIFHTKEDWYITTDEAMQHGIIDGIFGTSIITENIEEDEEE